MSNPRKVWYLLLDSTNGQPYKGTSASTVSLPSDHVIDQLRDAVKAENSNNLSGVDPLNLIVYKNRASFDQRNVETGKEEPLEEDSMIADLGSLKKDALIVVVPVSLSTSKQYTKFFTL